MATILDKDLVRESTVDVGGRQVLVTITADQTISMKLKGMKSGIVSISIADLYTQLTSDGSTEVEVAKPTKSKSGGSDLMSLNDIRSRFMVKGLDYPTTVLFDTIMDELIEDNKR